jgi:hypothetical protein
MRFSWTLCVSVAETSSANGTVVVVCSGSSRVCSHVRRAEDCAVPVGHEKIIALVQAVGACLCFVALLLVEKCFSRKVARVHARRSWDCPYRLRGLSRPSPALPAGGSYAVLLRSWLCWWGVIGKLFWVLVRACDDWERLQVGIGKI